jgi:hypothetical protein
LNRYGKFVTSDSYSTKSHVGPMTDFLPPQSDFSDKLLEKQAYTVALWSA